MRAVFGVLGPVVAWDGAGESIALRGPRHRAVLARLIVARRRVVPVSHLVADLWEEPATGTVSAVRTFVAALRRALEPERPPRAPARLLVTEGPGYALRAEPDAVDAWRFERVLASAAAGPPAAALDALDEALGWWRGPGYADFADAHWARAERARLAELRLQAVERRAGARLALGLAADAVPDLDAHVAEHPWREDAWRLLALALYRSGRQGDALAVLRRARTLLVEQLGVDPGPALRRLESDVLAQAEGLAGDAEPVVGGGSGTGVASDVGVGVGGSAGAAGGVGVGAGVGAGGSAGAAEASAAAEVWARAAADYDLAVSAGARARLESTVGLLRGLAVTGGRGLVAARAHRLAAIAAAEETDDPELVARVIGAYDVPAVWTRTDDAAQAAEVVAAAERALTALAALEHPPGAEHPAGVEHLSGVEHPSAPDRPSGAEPDRGPGPDSGPVPDPGPDAAPVSAAETDSDLRFHPVRAAARARLLATIAVESRGTPSEPARTPGAGGAGAAAGTVRTAGTARTASGLGAAEGAGAGAEGGVGGGPAGRPVVRAGERPVGLADGAEVSGAAGDAGPRARTRPASAAPEPRTRPASAAREAVALARWLDDPQLLAFALNGLFMQSCRRSGLAPRRDGIGDELVDLAARHGLVTYEVLGHLIRVQARSALADFGTADRHAEAADRLAARHELPLVGVFTRGYRALRLAAYGPGPAAPAPEGGARRAPNPPAAEHPPARYEVAEAAYREVGGLLAGAGMPGLERGWVALALLCLRLSHGLPAQTDPDTDWGPYAPWARPLVLLALGRRERAADALRQAPEPPADLLREALWCLLARAAVTLGDRPVMLRARAELTFAASELGGAGSGFLSCGPVAGYLAELAAGLGAETDAGPAAAPGAGPAT